MRCISVMANDLLECLKELCLKFGAFGRPWGKRVKSTSYRGTQILYIYGPYAVVIGEIKNNKEEILTIRGFNQVSGNPLVEEVIKTLTENDLPFQIILDKDDFERTIAAKIRESEKRALS